MKRLLLAVAVAVLAAIGCGDDGKNVDPKLAPDTKIDPKIKPAQATGTSKGELKKE